MAGNKHNLSIHAAVMNCLARCSDSDTPYVCLGDFLTELSSMGWSADDVEQVRTATLRKLGELRRHRPSDAYDATLAAN